MVRGALLDQPEGQGRTLVPSRQVAALGDTIVEVGTDYDGFYYEVAEDFEGF